MRLDANPSFLALKKLANHAKHDRMINYFKEDPARVEHFSIQAPYVYGDFSKNLISNATKKLLIELSQNAEIQNRIKDLFSGVALNRSEGRPALHTALRALNKPALQAADPEIHREVTTALSSMKRTIEKLHSQQWLGSTGKPIKQLVSIGIGGSYLGPKTVIEGLRHFHRIGVQTFFVSNIDGSDVANVLEELDPESCLFLVQSKSFTTLETLENARACISWLKDQLGDDCDISKHLAAVSSNIPKAVEFGVSEEHIFPMWDWVGGRYSLWSAIGFPIAFQLGFDNFLALLAGAEEMDEHFYSEDIERNLPLMLALVGIWNRSFIGHASVAVIPYDHQLRFLPEHLQQLDMESNGKTTDYDGHQISYPSGPLLFGGAGTNGQHAYHQLFHQGRGAVPIDFIIAKYSPYQVRDNHAHLLGNCLAQSQALMVGKSTREAYQELVDQGMSEDEARAIAPHKMIKGNKPNNILMVNQFTPHSIGALIALYEHKVFAQGQLWGINSFDQWGVELGKVLEKELFPLLTGTAPNPEEQLEKLDPSTANLIKKLRP